MCGTTFEMIKNDLNLEVFFFKWLKVFLELIKGKNASESWKKRWNDFL